MSDTCPSSSFPQDVSDLNSPQSATLPPSHIPPELFQLIMEFIDDRSSLYALTLSSHFLRHEAEPYLYASPMSSVPSPSTQYLRTTDKSKSGPTNNPAVHITFLRTIVTSPRLAALVRAYHSPSVLRHSDSLLWDLTRRGLGMMKGLRELWLRTFDGRPAAASLLLQTPQTVSQGRGFWISRSRASRARAFDAGDIVDISHDLCSVSFLLSKLHWGCHSDEESMAKFLIKQPQMRELYLEIRTPYKQFFEISPIYSNAESFPLSVIPVPHLEKIGGNRWTIEAFLPGRCITRLEWIPHIDDSIVDPLPLPVVKEMRKVKILEFGGYFMRPHFRKLAAYLEELEVLELVGAYGDELALLKGLPNLRSLMISIPGASRDSPISSKCPETRNLAVSTLFTNCERLQYVDLAMDRGYVSGSAELNGNYSAVWYLRWKKPLNLEHSSDLDVSKKDLPSEEGTTWAIGAQGGNSVGAQGRGAAVGLKSERSSEPLQLGEPMLLSMDEIIAERLIRHY